MAVRVMSREDIWGQGRVGLSFLERSQVVWRVVSHAQFHLTALLHVFLIWLSRWMLVSFSGFPINLFCNNDHIFGSLSQHLGLLLSVGGHWQKLRWHMTNSRMSEDVLEIIIRLKFPHSRMRQLLKFLSYDILPGASWLTHKLLTWMRKESGEFC